MEKTLEKIISVSGFEAQVAHRMGEPYSEKPLCVCIGEAEIARFGGAQQAVSRCSHDVLTDLALALIWRDTPAARPAIAQIDAMLGLRQMDGGSAGCA